MSRFAIEIEFSGDYNSVYNAIDEITNCIPFLDFDRVMLRIINIGNTADFDVIDNE